MKIEHVKPFAFKKKKQLFSDYAISPISLWNFAVPNVMQAFKEPKNV